ncbi:PREDICTED: uncharacterized protein LOC109592726 [Amphimedon queenslandica]|uniref:Uncharacterized protein n=1 Tax=Amphimedon queenslandica TaxID=400682 RepID=A0A1X7SJR0_AMPQE|nr:PREDICTED: uncharacterized protein LOC109592726 [Amphimedon queenslandica]|eukprot:XP_019863667.1 PREDICTED: uncharacterized protein LOC109592726 [Amphimedon queenslandica]
MTLLDDDPELNMSILKTGENEREGDDTLFTEIEDHSDLLNVGTLDDVLKVAHEKPKKKPKPKSVQKPLGASLFDDEKERKDGVDAMGTDDISKYIQMNQEEDDDDLELF